tara:strand:+ start:304 stop:492 length:189 start_codon:yes stop_codon:yes gene_type:complete
MSVIKKDLISGAGRSLVARVLWDYTFLQMRLVAVTYFLTFIKNKKGEGDRQNYTSAGALAIK